MVCSDPEVVAMECSDPEVVAMEKRSARIVSALSSSALGQPANLYAQFVEYAPAIELAIRNGHSRNAIVEWLATQGLILPLKRYDTYLWRYRLRRKKASNPQPETRSSQLLPNPSSHATAQTEQDLLTYLETASQSADGQLKAIQVGNQIAEQQVQQMLKLRQLMMADLQSKAAFQNNQIMQQNQAAQARKFFQTSGKFANGAGGSSSSSGGAGATPSAMAITPRN